MTTPARQWAPAALLFLGVVLVRTLDRQQAVDLRRPLAAAIPVTLQGFQGRDLELPEAQRRIAGFTAYLLRIYTPAPEGLDTLGGAEFSVYVGYYAWQTQGSTIHSPKNCLPGAGWEPVTANRVALAGDRGPLSLNRYVVQNGDRRALVLYWYQGRGRVQASEYRVKWNLLRDAILLRRTEEALVRIVVPIRGSEAAATALALDIAHALVPAVHTALPSTERVAAPPHQVSAAR